MQIHLLVSNAMLPIWAITMPLLFPSRAPAATLSPLPGAKGARA
jgi:hypothetical protein